MKTEPHKLMNPASTTKIMTAIVALEKGNLEDIVTTGKNTNPGGRFEDLSVGRGKTYIRENAIWYDVGLG